MNTTSLFCFPFTTICYLTTEWTVIFQAITALCTLIVSAYGIWKIRHELKRLKEQRDKENEDKLVSASLKRTEFFLDQHRRLFDNPELYEILCLIDDDNVALADATKMADKKRKFLTFFEEIALLVNSKQIDEKVACYMFGYYATCVLKGKNFAVGIDTSKQHWGLLYKFAATAKKYFEDHPQGPPSEMKL